MLVDPSVLEVLKNQAVCDGSRVSLTGQLDRKTYTKVNEVLEACGLKWSRKEKCHVSETDAEDLVRAVIDTGQITTYKDLGFFPTPVALATRLCADVPSGSLVLEPSAGTGRIVRALRARACPVIACERDPKMREELVKMGAVVSPCDDFMDMNLTTRPDAVVMNPPFCKVGKGDHLDHVRHAFDLLKPGGLLISILPSSVEFRQDRRYVAFREFFDNAKFTRLPPDSFRESGTGVNTITMGICKDFE